MISFTTPLPAQPPPPPPSAEIIFPSKGQTDIARSFDVVIRIRGAIDTSKLYCRYNATDTTLEPQHRPGLLVITKDNKDTLLPSKWNRYALHGSFELVNDSTLKFHSFSNLKYNTMYTIVIDSLKKLAGGSYTRDTCNFTVTSPPHSITKFSLDNSRRLKCNDTITIEFNEPIDSLNTPSGSIVQILQSDSTGQYANPIPLTTWFDGTHKKVYVRPISPYILGAPYYFKVNTHFLNGDTTSSISALFDVKKGYTITGSPKIIGLPGSPSEHDADSIADYLLSNYVYPAANGRSFVADANAKIYAQRVVGVYRFLRFESITDSVMFHNIPTNSSNYTQQCQNLHDVSFRAIYEIIPKQNFVFRADSNASLFVHYHDSTYTVSATDSITIEMYVDSTDKATIWASPHSGYSFIGWNSNVSPYNNIPPSTGVTIKINPIWNVGGWIEPVIGITQMSDDYAWSATAVAQENDDNETSIINSVGWPNGKRASSGQTPALRTLSATAPDCFVWVSGGDITDGGKTITKERLTTNPEDKTTQFVMQRIRISLRIEQRHLANYSDENTLSSKEHIAWDGSLVKLKHSDNSETIITGPKGGGFITRYEDPSPLSEKKPYLAVNNILCGKTSAYISQNEDEVPRRLDDADWLKYQAASTPPGYHITTNPANAVVWDALVLNEANATYTSVETGQKEVRVRQLFTHKFKLLEIGLNILQSNGNFKQTSRKFIEVKKIGYVPKDEDDAEAGTTSTKYPSVGAAEIKFVFNEKLDLTGWNAFIPISIIATGGIDQKDRYFTAMESYGNFIYDGALDGVLANRHYYTFKLTDIAHKVQKMSSIELNLQTYGGKLKSISGEELEEGYQTYITDIEMPYVDLILTKMKINDDTDFWGEGEIYSYYTGGVATVGAITRPSTGNKLPAGEQNSVDHTDTGEEITSNLLFAQKSRIRKTDAIFAWISTYDNDDPGENNVSDVTTPIGNGLLEIKAEIDKNATKKVEPTPDPKDKDKPKEDSSLETSDVIGIIGIGISEMGKAIDALIESGDDYEHLGEQLFTGRRSTFFGKYDSGQTEFTSNNKVTYFWKVTLE